MTHGRNRIAISDERCPSRSSSLDWWPWIRPGSRAAGAESETHHTTEGEELIVRTLIHRPKGGASGPGHRSSQDARSAPDTVGRRVSSRPRVVVGQPLGGRYRLIVRHSFAGSKPAHIGVTEGLFAGSSGVRRLFGLWPGSQVRLVLRTPVDDAGGCSGHLVGPGYGAWVAPCLAGGHPSTPDLPQLLIERRRNTTTAAHTSSVATQTIAENYPVAAARLDKLARREEPRQPRPPVPALL